MKVYFAADHAGFEMKNELLRHVASLGYETEDCGALVFSESDDYPQIIAGAAHKLSKDAQNGIQNRAIILGGSGQGEAIVANRFRGVRAAVYYGVPRGDHTSDSGRGLDIIILSREHNDANALSLGARFIALDEAKEVVRIWLQHEYKGEARHARRIKEIDDIVTT